MAGFRIYEPTLLANPFHIEDGLACVPAGSCPGVEISGDPDKVVSYNGKRQVVQF